MAFSESNCICKQHYAINFKVYLRDNSLNTPLPPLPKVPTEGFSA